MYRRWRPAAVPCAVAAIQKLITSFDVCISSRTSYLTLSSAVLIQFAEQCFLARALHSNPSVLPTGTLAGSLHIPLEYVPTRIICQTSRSYTPSAVCVLRQDRSGNPAYHRTAGLCVPRESLNWPSKNAGHVDRLMVLWDYRRNEDALPRPKRKTMNTLARMCDLLPPQRRQCRC